MAKMDKDLSFEQALRELERIVEELERNEVSLEDCIKQYESGIRLYKFCMEKLNQLEGKIEILIKELDGSFSKREFKLLGEIEEDDIGED